MKDNFHLCSKKLVLDIHVELFLGYFNSKRLIYYLLTLTMPDRCVAPPTWLLSHISIEFQKKYAYSFRKVTWKSFKHYSDAICLLIEILKVYFRWFFFVCHSHKCKITICTYLCFSVWIGNHSIVSTEVRIFKCLQNLNKNIENCLNCLKKCAKSL